jgi:hypothetical protein
MPKQMSHAVAVYLQGNDIPRSALMRTHYVTIYPDETKKFLDELKHSKKMKKILEETRVPYSILSGLFSIFFYLLLLFRAINAQPYSNPYHLQKHTSPFLTSSKKRNSLTYFIISIIITVGVLQRVISIMMVCPIFIFLQTAKATTNSTSTKAILNLKILQTKQVLLELPIGVAV